MEALYQISVVEKGKTCVFKYYSDRWDPKKLGIFGKMLIFGADYLLKTSYTVRMILTGGHY
jgi:hypothetical protein